MQLYSMRQVVTPVTRTRFTALFFGKPGPLFIETQLAVRTAFN